jgi:cytochrome c-type biogenesis protein CcmH/NrfF
MRLGRTARRVLWIVAAAVLIGMLAVAGRGDGRPPTNEERVQALSEELACPECAGQSVANSSSPAAQNVRRAVAEMVRDGDSDDEIRARITDRFGEEVSLVPAGSGVVGLVWVVPVVVAVLAVAAIIAVLIGWRRSVGAGGAPSAADRELVDRFLSERVEATEPERRP